MGCSVYALFDPRDPDHYRYIGKTIHRVSRRFNWHVWSARNLENHTYKDRWIRKLLRHGISLGWEIVEKIKSDDLEVHSDREIHWIAELKKQGHRLTNGTLGGEGVPGRKTTEETKRKISLATSGKKVSLAGRQRISEGQKKRFQNPEERLKLSKIHTGKKLSDEHRRNISKAGKGRIVSEETRRRISESNRGRVPIAETRKKWSKARKGKQKRGENPYASPVLQFNEHGDLMQRWGCIKDVVVFFNLDSHAKISHCASKNWDSNKQHKSMGYVWRYEDDRKRKMKRA